MCSRISLFEGHEVSATTTTTTWTHDTVLLNEAVDALSIKPSGTYIDGTFGRGGHAALILQRLGPDGHLLGVDRDLEAVAFAQAWRDSRFAIRHQAFHTISDLPEASVDGLLMDLGALTVGFGEIGFLATGFLASAVFVD
ncbi:16S rRNA (cytosine(1402)-N(4))-methyltransferase [Burkholderiaceae bacterium]|nr:16S rRNA (cytosine(1402)-N(4))-methyltransferase [Burkholderiaceae bacterium]